MKSLESLIPGLLANALLVAFVKCVDSFPCLGVDSSGFFLEEWLVWCCCWSLSVLPEHAIHSGISWFHAFRIKGRPPFYDLERVRCLLQALLCTSFETLISCQRGVAVEHLIARESWWDRSISHRTYPAPQRRLGWWFRERGCKTISK